MLTIRKVMDVLPIPFLLNLNNNYSNSTKKLLEELPFLFFFSRLAAGSVSAWGIFCNVTV